MMRSQGFKMILLLTLFCSVWVYSTSVCQAQPLVTDGLSVYYSFDQISEGTFLDGSPNGLHGLITLGEEDANEDGLDDIRVDTEDKQRGAGSARFDTDPTRDNIVLNPDYIAVCDPVNNTEHNEGCGEDFDLADFPAYVPSNGFTVATWAKVEDAGGQDHALFQSWASGRGFNHTYIEANGNARVTLRGFSNSDKIMQYRAPPGGEPVPFDEWVHFAGTYQRDDIESEDPGEWAFYLNGEEIANGVADLDVAGTELEVLGGWGQGAFLGLVPDMKSQLVGWLDEFYLFNRGLSAEEIATIYTGGSPLEGDYNGNGEIDAGDLDVHSQYMKDNNPAGDRNGDGVTDSADRIDWVEKVQKSWLGDSNFDGEFNSGDFVDVFTAGKYDTGNMAGAAEGDWDGNMLFDSGDFVAAFTHGGYEIGPPPGAAAVPEPSSMVLLAIAALVLTGVRRRK